MSRKRNVVRGVAIAALVLLLPTCCVLSFRDHIGTSPTRDGAAIRGLPSDATDIQWFLPGAFGPSKVYSFITTEEGYRQWVKDGRYCTLSGPHYGPYEIEIYDHAKRSFGFHKIDDAIAFTWTEEDRGVYMVYDRGSGRAYFHSHSR